MWFIEKFMMKIELDLVKKIMDVSVMQIIQEFVMEIMADFVMKF